MNSRYVVERAKTWVGTPQYISPELLEVSETSRRQVPWCLGVEAWKGSFVFIAPIFGHWDASYIR